MEVQTVALRKELEWLNHFIEKKTTIPILSNVLFEADGKRLKLTATDLEIGGITSIAGTGKGKWSTIAPIAGLIKYLKKVDEDTVTLSADEIHWLTLTHGPGKSRTAGMSKDSYPELPAAPPATAWLFNLPQAIDRTLFAVSADESRFTLNGALLEINESTAQMVATDGHRLALAPVKVKCASKIKALLPKKFLALASKMEGDCALAVNDAHSFLDYGQRQMVSRKLEGNFPGWSRVMANDMPNHAVIPVKSTLKTLERVAVYADERSHAVVFSLEDGKLTIKAKSVECGEAEGSVPIQGGEYVPLPEYGLNANYVSDFLTRTEAQSVAFCYMNDGEPDGNGNIPPHSRAVAQSCQFATSDGWRYCVSPMRI